MTVHLVRHGRPLVVPGVRAADWDLDPASYDDVWALRASGRLPGRAAWFSSPEPKAIHRRPPDLERGASLAMPDLITVP